MPQVLLVNPSERKGRKMARKKARTAAQKAATRKMIAANKARKSARKSPARAKVRTRTVVKHRTRVVHAAPKTHKKRRTHRRTSAVAASNAGRTLRFRRTNPVGFFGDTLNMLVPSAVGGLGALGTDIVLGLPFIPDSIKTGPMRPVARVGAAIGLGMIAGMVTSKTTAKQITAGALTVVMYDTIKAMLAKVAGGKIPGIGTYDIPGVGMYEVQSQPSIGYADAGQQVGEYVSGDTVAEYVS